MSRRSDTPLLGFGLPGFGYLGQAGPILRVAGTGLMDSQEISFHFPVSGGPPGILPGEAGLTGWWVLPAPCDPTIRVVPLRGTCCWWAT